MTAGVTFLDPPTAARAALDLLVASDSNLAGIEARAGTYPGAPAHRGFSGMLQPLVAQQIGNHGPAAIWGPALGDRWRAGASGLVALADESLHAARLSRPQMAHVRVRACGASG